MSTRYWPADDIDNMKNAKGFGVSWQRIAAYYGVSVDEIKRAVGEPQFRDAPASQANNEPDLFSGCDRLNEVL